MNLKMKSLVGVLIGLFLFSGLPACVQKKSKIKAGTGKIVAPTPPMGWNSFDAYDCRINEEQFKKTVDFMADNLLKYGWEYAVIDYIWWHPNPGAWDNPTMRYGHPNIRYANDGKPIDPTTIDEYGRLLPAVERFPSAAGGKGFKPLADYVHAKGMKFGIHIMRGIHRSAWYDNLPIMGSQSKARDIAEPHDTCGWCNHMYGVDPTKEGAQDYYNSLFKLYAEWEVDFIKADDTMYPPYHKGEIEMIRKAIDQCGHPMVLSLSCGEAPLGMANHLKTNANMWRISGDFWDDWESLEHNFDLMNAWSSCAVPNSWPDADMLPIGKISLDNRPHGPERKSNFTLPEHYTLMSLWSIARSPLFIGADLLQANDSLMFFLTNPEVIAVNQNSTDNRQVFQRQKKCAWIATNPETKEKYLALFNLAEKEQVIEFDFELEYLRGKYSVRDLWQRADLGRFENRFSVKLPSHGAGLYKLTKL